MLQIKATILVLAAALSVAAAARADSGGPEWLLADIPEQEFLPLSQVAVTLPADVQSALDLYHRENFRKTVEILEKLHALKLPDGRLDFIVFVLAESYRKLGCTGLARDDYQYVLGVFPGSDKSPASLYRLLEFAVTGNESARADSLYGEFCAKYPAHPLAAFARYLAALDNYKHSEYDKALEKLDQIPPSSSALQRARFLQALCWLQTRQFPRAMEALDAIRRRGGGGEIVWETAILTGDIYYLQNNPDLALKYYLKVPEKAKRRDYALVRAAQCELDIGKYKQSAKIALRFLEDNANSPYYFEIASVSSRRIPG